MTEQQVKDVGGELFAFVRRHALAIIPILIGLGVFLSEFRALQIEVLRTRDAVTELRRAWSLDERNVARLQDLERLETRLHREVERLRDTVQIQQARLIDLRGRAAPPPIETPR